MSGQAVTQRGVGARVVGGRATLWGVAASIGLAGIALIAAELPARGSLLPAVGLLGLVLALLVLVRPDLGFYAIIFCAGVVRLKIGTGTGSALVPSLGAAVVLCVCWLVHQILHRRQVNFLPRAIAFPGLALIGFTLFSLLWGRVTLDPRIELPATFLRVQLAATSLFVVSIGLLFAGGDLLRDRRLRGWIVGGLIVVGFAALPFRAAGIPMPIFGVFGLFGLWFVVACWSQALANERLPVPLRVILGGGALGWLGVQFVTQRDWTSGWLPPLLALVLVTILLRPWLGWSIAGAMAVFAVLFQQLVDDLIASEEAQGSLGGEFGRFELWARNLEILRDQLLFGTGPAGYALYYITLVPEQAMSTHNNYLDIVAETGVFGLLSFLALLGGLAWVGWRLLPHLTNGADRAICAAALGGLFAAIQAMTLGDWVIPFVYNQTIAGFDHAVYTWLMLAMICGLWAQRRYPLPDHA